MTTPSVERPVRRGLAVVATNPWRIDARDAECMGRMVGLAEQRNHGPMVSPVYTFRLMRRHVCSATLSFRMTASIHDTSIEPLFAQNARLWLRIWLATQLVGTLVATAVEV